MFLLLLPLIFSIREARAVSFEEIRALAADRSLALAARELEAKALEVDAVTAGRWQNPQVTGQFGTLRAGSSRGATTEVSVTQPFPLSDRYALRRELAQLAASQQKTRTEFFRRWVRHQAVLSSWRVVTARALYEHRVERSKKLSLIKSYIESRPRVSPRQRVELALIRTALLQIEGLQDEKASELKRALADLEFWTGRIFSPEELAFALPEAPLVAPEARAAAPVALEVLLAKTELRSAALEAELARKERRPDLFVGGGYRLEDVAPRNHFTYAIAGVTVPIWDTGLARLEAANVRRRASEHELREAERAALLKHRKLAEELTLGLARIKRFSRDLIPKTERSLGEAEGAFRQGLLDVNVFLQAETQFHEVMDEVYHSWIGYLETLSDYQLLRNEDLSWQK